MKKLFTILLMLCGICGSAQNDEDESRGYTVKVGQTAPDFTITYLDGKTAKLSDLKGKVVMIQFTASWCGVCRKEMPLIESDIRLKHKNNPEFVLIGIDYKEPKEKVAEFARQIKITYPLTLDESGEIFHKFAAKDAGVTRNVVIDRDGKIIFLTRLYDPKEFKKMKSVIETELKKKK